MQDDPIISVCGECDYFPCAKINAVFEKTEHVIMLCKEKCNENEYKQLKNAFFMKREILEEVNRKQRRS